ncbi:MAG: Trk family potassium uptake protein [Deltaproteobacteria bacterium]|nr:Trk family potassium uptake protein [Deltaproteobacteria bacterium]
MALVALLVLEGWELVHTPALRLALHSAVVLAIVLSTWQQAIRLRLGPRRLRYLARIAPETVLLVLLCLLYQRPALWAFIAFVRQSSVVARMATSTERYRRFMESLQARPAQMLALSFMGIILGGALLLTFPRATTDGLGAGWVDALFTSTSATCVTGLATLNTVADQFADPSRQTFSEFGQAVILLLIQVGALGIMTLSAATIILVGRRLSLRSASLMQEILDETSTSALKSAIRSIFLMTFVIEALGAAALYPRFADLGNSPVRAVWLSVFHAISAFCNAGFSLYGDSLASFRGDLWVNAVHAGLIILGGLGFTVVGALVAPRTWRHGSSGFWRSLPLQARLALVMTGILLTGGTILYYFFEFDHSLAGLPVREKLIASAFQSVSFRTAGFNTVDMAALSRPMLLVSCLLMFIGASPGSTAGGVKTTTVAVLVMSIRSSLMGHSHVEMGRRTIPSTVVTRSVSIVIMAGAVMSLGLVALLMSQPHISFDALLFETLSALGTVGLSMGVTPQLTAVGKLVIIALMFVGRLGPLTVALAVGRTGGQSYRGYRYVEGKVIVG